MVGGGEGVEGREEEGEEGGEGREDLGIEWVGGWVGGWVDRGEERHLLSIHLIHSIKRTHPTTIHSSIHPFNE